MSALTLDDDLARRATRARDVAVRLPEIRRRFPSIEAADDPRARFLTLREAGDGTTEEWREVLYALREQGARVSWRADAENYHAEAAWREGRPLCALDVDLSPIERFRAYVAVGADHDYWTGRTNDRGFATFYPEGRSGSAVVVTRFVWTEILGHPAPDRYREIVRPTCGEKACVRPSHLTLIRRDKRRYSDEAILGAAQVLAMRLGRTPRQKDWLDARTKPVADMVLARFGSWERFVERAGLPPVERAVSDKFSDEAILDAIRADAAERGRPSYAHEWSAERRSPSEITIRRRFGSFAEALRAAGLA